MRVILERADHEEISLVIGLATSMHDVISFLRQFEPKLGKMNAGTGIDCMRLLAICAVLFKKDQMRFGDD